VNGSLLSSVGEVVVSGGHVIKVSSDVHSDEASIKVSRSRIELHAVLNILLCIVLVVLILDKELFISEAVDLIQHGHSKSQSLSFEQRRSLVSDPAIISRNILSDGFDLDDVVSVSAVGSFSSISCRIGVATGPLEVDVISNSAIEGLRNKVVFGGRISLDDVSSLSSHVEIEDSGDGRNSIGSWLNVEDVASILEGSSVLSGIQSQLVRLSILRNDLIVGDGRSLGIRRFVDESRVGSVSIGTHI